MSKKGKLHTLSKYEADRLNHIAFMPREDKNIFNGLLTPSNSLSTPNFNSYNFGNYNFGNYKPFASSDIFKQYGASTTGSIKSGYNTGNIGVGSGVFNSKSWGQRSLDGLFPVYNFSNSLSPFSRHIINQGSLGVTPAPKSAATTKTTTGVTPAGYNMWKPSNETMQGWADNWYETAASKYTQKSIDAANAGDYDTMNKYGDKLAKLDADVAKYGSATEAYKNSKNALGISKQANPFSKMNIGQTFGTLASIAPRELFDTLDPVYHLAGGRESAIGNGLSEAGVGLFKAGAQSGNGALMLAGAGAKVFGGLWNGAFGIKENKENVEFIKNNTLAARDAGGMFAQASDNADLLDRAKLLRYGSGFAWNDLYKNGWLTSKGTRKGTKLVNKELAALAYQNNAFADAANQTDRANDERALSSFITAYGGPLHRGNKYDNGGFLDNLDTSDMGEATKYSLAQDYLTMKNNEIKTDAKLNSMYAGTPGTFFAEGGPAGNRWVNSVGTVGPGGFVPNNLRGTYGGGIGLGGGAGTRISDVPEYETTVQNDTIWIPVERTFNDAFREAVRNGQDSFMFNGELKNVEFEDNPKWKEAGDARKETVGFFPLVTEKKKTERKKAEGGPLNILCGGGKFFALGGDMQTNGADFPTGLTHIDAGLSHEINPNEGVQVGVDSKGTPNLVEEGETIWNDYVFSNRIKLDNTTKDAFHINKKRDITYADEAKRLEKEVKERPNDPISQAAFNAQMEKLQEQQERQKAEMEARRAQEAFAALSPEEQVAVMQQAVAQEQATQEAAMQEQAMAEQQAMQGQPTPEEAAMMQQEQMMQAEPQMSQPQVVEPQAIEQPMMAYGGHKYDKGGVLELLKKLGYKTKDEAIKAGWKASDFGDSYTSWDDIDDKSLISDNFKWSDEFSKRITSPQVKAAMSLGWSPTASLLKGNWYENKDWNKVGWTESARKKALNAAEFQEYADRYKNTIGYAIKNGLLKAPEGDDTISTEDIVKAMVQTPDWKATDDWLYGDIANQAAYIGMARNLNPDNDTDFINKWSQFGTFTKGDDNTWNYTLRDNLSDKEKDAFTSLFKRARSDNKIGVMYNNFHNPGKETKRYVLDKDGNVSLIDSNDLSKYEQLGEYTWGDEPNDLNKTAVLYSLKNAAEAETPAATTKGDPAATDTAGTAAKTEGQPVKKKYVPNLLPETKLGLLGPIAGLTMQAMGIGKPDYTELDKALAISNRPTKLASYQPIGDYIKYRPMDIWAAQNSMNANARATDRTIRNTTSPAANAALLANAYTSQLGSGELFRQSLEYNDALKKQVAEFNRGTNIQNANAFNQLSQFNANEINEGNNRKAYMATNIAGKKLDANAAWKSGYYDNVNALFKGIGDYEREVRDRNTMAKMVASGIYPGVNLENALYAGLLEEVAAEGGKIKRKKNKKRGLTI